MRDFPDGFLWGTVLSGHGSEGDNFNSDWWRWEQRPGRISDGSTSQAAAGHAERFATDFELAAKLGVRAHMVTVEWSKVQPERDRFDENALEHYSRVFACLREHGIEPVCVLNHVTLPLWLAQSGGWRRTEVPSLFSAYVRRVADRLAPHCRRWIPMLEPENTIYMGWLLGTWPPGAKSLIGARSALLNAAIAHAAAYDAIHAAQSDALVGPAARARCLRPLDETSAWDLRAARCLSALLNHSFLRAVVQGRKPWPSRAAMPFSGKADFVGVSYYGRQFVRFALGRPSGFAAGIVTKEGKAAHPDDCEEYPAGLGESLGEFAQYARPLLVTGNGLSTNDDALRCRFLLDHLETLGRSTDEGLDVHGYFHRSLLDCFEWDRGHSRRYGLIHVGRETLGRTPNTSAFLYKDICQTGALRTGTIARFCPGWVPPVHEGEI